MSEQKDAVHLEKLEGNGFTRNKWLIALAIILLLAVAASVTALVLLGLILSPWLVIPCVLFVAAICLVGKIFYDEHQFKLNGNTFSTKVVNVTPDEIRNAVGYDPSNQPAKQTHSSSPSVNRNRSSIFKGDHSPKPTHLNLVLIGKPEAMPIARKMFCNFAEKSEDTVNDLCILNDFSFDETTTISLFEVKSADDIAQLKTVDSTLKFDAAVITFLEEEQHTVDEKTFSTEKFIMPNSNVLVELPVTPPSPAEVYVYPLDDEYALAKQLNCNHGALRHLILGKKMDGKNNQPIDNNQVIRDIITNIIKTLHDSRVLLDYVTHSDAYKIL